MNIKSFILNPQFFEKKILSGKGLSNFGSQGGQFEKDLERALSLLRNASGFFLNSRLNSYVRESMLRIKH